ncbi:MAG: hypothetical protein JSV45_03760 [Chromatiales bacterium]|nr:MAG: hypothetical protein JSV45_03760 [Chromatiales bacterium]
MRAAAILHRWCWCLLWPAIALADGHEYPVTFGAVIKAGRHEAEAFIRVDQDAGLLEQVRLRAPTRRYSRFSGDGEFRRVGDQVIWDVPADGGRLNYRVNLKHRRGSGGYDARVENKWAIFRLDDLFPPAGISQVDGSRSRSRLSIAAPDGWKTVTRYQQLDGRRWRVTNPKRKFDRPTGWAVTGRLNIRRDLIDGTQVTIAGPVGEGVQRVSMLALLRWTLPALLDIAPDAPRRLLVVSAADPMWRGGLSGPGSLFMHADLPLLSEDGTSTLLHETVHAVLPVPTADDHDWIDEGLAEYLTLRLLERTGTISPARFLAAVERFRERGTTADGVLTSQAAGAVTARAVALFHDLDAELVAATDGAADIEALAATLAKQREPIDLEALRAVTLELAGTASLPSLADEQLRAFRRQAEM